MRAYHNSLAMGCIKADWVSRGPETSSFDPTMTIHGRICSFLGALVQPLSLCSSFLPVFIHDTNYNKQGNGRAAQMPNRDTSLIQKLTAMMHACNHRAQSVVALRVWVTPVDASNLFCMVIRSDKPPAEQHVRQFNGFHASEVAAFVLGAEDVIVDRQEIALRHRGELNGNGSERRDTIRVTHRSYNPLSYVLLLPHGTNGWHAGQWPKNGSTARCRSSKLSQLMFYAQDLFQRPLQISTIFLKQESISAVCLGSMLQG